MDDETPAMESVTAQMRDVMRRWIGEPSNQALKARYERLQAEYQRLFMEYKKGSRTA